MKRATSSQAGTERYTAIVDAARNLFGTRGFQSVSLDEIARTAGVSKGLVNYHFGSKEDLLAYVLINARIRLSEKLDAIKKSSAPTKEKIQAAVEVYLNAVSSRPSLTQMALSALSEGGSSEKARLLWVDSLEENLLKFANLVDEGVAKGEFKPVDSQQITHFVIGMVFEMIRVATMHQKTIQPDKLTKEVVDVLFNGISR